MHRTVYVPDALDRAVASTNLKINFSRLLQTALTKEIQMHDAVSADGEFAKVVVRSESEDRSLSFYGRPIAAHARLNPRSDLTVYLTRKGRLLLEDRVDGEYEVYTDFDDLATNGNVPGALVAAAARAVGIEYVEELDV